MFLSGCRLMWAQNSKQKTNSPLQESFRFLSSSKRSVIGCQFSDLHFAPTWNNTLKVPSHVGAKCKAENQQPITEYFQKKEISTISVIGCSFSALHFTSTWDGTLSVLRRLITRVREEKYTCVSFTLAMTLRLTLPSALSNSLPATART